MTERAVILAAYGTLILVMAFITALVVRLMQ